MSSEPSNNASIELPILPARHDKFIDHVANNPQMPMRDILEPYKQYDSKLREVFAQQPGHDALSEPNIVSVFEGHQEHIKIRARDLDAESEEERQRYLLPLDDASRRPKGSPAVVQSLSEFRNNFNIFSESALADMDWSNCVVCGSAALTPLLAVPSEHAGSKRALRQYYHEKVAPASDVDLFLYDLTEEQAIKKIKQIEQHIRDSILTETTTIRTKNAITIASQYPTRHIQIVLRIYRSISEILTGFDVDCSCVAYDGKQVWASPRALTACMTQVNTIDLTRRSPSYETRLSKYSHRGFEVYWPLLDRSRIDPTIFERSFNRVVGLARLLVLEKLPTGTDRDAYQDQRRAERGRPRINRYLQQSFTLKGNIKEQHDDEVADWVDEEEVSNYHTFTIPYGPKYHARSIEKLLYKKDLLLNAEWNKSKDREVNLHRHPAFFGGADNVIHDCCGYCPKPITPEEQEAYEVESKRFVSGEVSFLKDDPGRQAIGSFHPLTDDDWTEMGYIGNTTVLCNAIVDQDLEAVQDWLSQEGADPNRRDHTGRAPIHLAVMLSSLDIVQCLIENGARIVARLVDGQTALHIAAKRGNVDIVSALLKKSEENEEEEDRKVSQRLQVAKQGSSPVKVVHDEAGDEDSDTSLIDGEDSQGDNTVDATTEHSYVKIESETKDEDAIPDPKDDEPDIYDVDVLAWDLSVSPLHLAIVHSHVDVVRTLISDFGASPLLPVKLVHDYNKSARAAILPLVLALVLPSEKAEEMTRTLLNLGASVAQGDLNQVSALHYFAVSDSRLLQVLLDASKPKADRAIRHLALSGDQWNAQVVDPLTSAVQKGDEAAVKILLDAGAKPEVHYASWLTSWKKKFEDSNRTSRTFSANGSQYNFESNFKQPVFVAASCELPSVVWSLVDSGADYNALTPDAYIAISDGHAQPRERGKSLLDVVEEKIEALKSYNTNKDDEYFKSVYFRQPVMSEPPMPLEDDEKYLGTLKPDSYTYWAVSEQLHAAKGTFRKSLEDYERQQEKEAEKQKALSRKQLAIDRLCAEFEKLAEKLRSKGAKKFSDMHPNAKEPHNYGVNANSYKPPKEAAWKPIHKFRGPNALGTDDDAYLDLFEACWNGDIQTIKALTLTASTEESTARSPLGVCVLDFLGHSTFQISVLRGHFDAAKIIMEIARVQYTPAGSTVRRRYTLGHAYDSDDDACDGDDDIQIHSEIVDDQFTIDNIGEVNLQVKSRTKPLDFLQQSFPSKRDSTQRMPLEGMPNLSSQQRQSICLAEANRAPIDLFQFAAATNDHKLFTFLLDVAEDHIKRRLPGDTDEDNPGFFSFAAYDFLYLISGSHTGFLAEVVRRTGAGIPLDDLVKRSGVEIAEAPKYYQGLSVYGKKRADWAQKERGARSQGTLLSHPPALEAARQGSLPSLRWFQSSEAKSCYSEFTQTNRNEKRLQSLAQSAHGLDASIGKWLTHHSHLLMHCVVLGKSTPKSIDLLRYLIETEPALLQARSLGFQTPLQLAFSLHQKDMAEVLIAAGADQTCRDKEGRNILHSTLVRNNLDWDFELKKIEPIMEMVSLIDSRLIPSLCTERASVDPGSVTPLALWLDQAGQKYRRNYYNGNAEVDEEGVWKMVQAILSVTKGIELDMINGAGDTPLHTAARSGKTSLLKVMLDARPELLHRENAVGRTPYEIAQDKYLAEVFADPPEVPGVRSSKYHRQQTVKSSILQREAATFVEDDNSGVDGMSDAKKTWKLCAEFDKNTEGAESGPSRKRKLVSLHEANEVAKRLACKRASARRGTRHRRRDMEDDEMEEVVTDEVEQWYNNRT